MEYLSVGAYGTYSPSSDAYTGLGKFADHFPISAIQMRVVEVSVIKVMNE